MIGIRVQGRLGNQLFQLAFAMAASKKLNTHFFIDQYIEHLVADKYFAGVTGKSHPAVARLFRIRGFKNIFSFHLRRLYYKYPVLIRKLPVVAYDYLSAYNEITLQNNVLYEGFFQSELFFKDIENLIRKKFTLKKKVTDQFRNKYSGLYQNNPVVTVHIRRTDYQNLPHLNLGGDDLTLPLEYYKKAMSKFADKNAHFIFVSDDAAFVDENFKEIKNKTISTDTEIMDFQHLLNADGCIISNSTFSWWGAWLNAKPGKIIYAPKYFMGWRIRKETPADIFPHDWILVDF